MTAIITQRTWKFGQKFHRRYVMNKSRIVFEGTPQVLRANPEIERQYLGI